MGGVFIGETKFRMGAFWDQVGVQHGMATLVAQGACEELGGTWFGMDAFRATDEVSV